MVHVMLYRKELLSIISMIEIVLQSTGPKWCEAWLTPDQVKFLDENDFYHRPLRDEEYK